MFAGLTAKEQVIRWNNMFPLDYWWRKKHSIPYGSPAHMAVSQFDILFEYLEEKAFEEQDKSRKEWEMRKTQMDAGIVFYENEHAKPSSEAELKKQMDDFMGEWMSQPENNEDVG
jgi:hypothetical protein